VKASLTSFFFFFFFFHTVKVISALGFSPFSFFKSGQINGALVERTSFFFSFSPDDKGGCSPPSSFPHIGGEGALWDGFFSFPLDNMRPWHTPFFLNGLQRLRSPPLFFPFLFPFFFGTFPREIGLALAFPHPPGRIFSRKPFFPFFFFCPAELDLRKVGMVQRGLFSTPFSSSGWELPFSSCRLSRSGVFFPPFFLLRGSGFAAPPPGPEVGRAVQDSRRFFFFFFLLSVDITEAGIFLFLESDTSTLKLFSFSCGMTPFPPSRGGESGQPWDFFRHSCDGG